MTLKAANASLDLSIRDDGVGFVVDQRRARLGLVGMTERAELAGGSLNVESAPGAGTTVRAKFPLTPQKVAAD